MGMHPVGSRSEANIQKLQENRRLPWANEPRLIYKMV
jgi:hypothetical protein